MRTIEELSAVIERNLVALLESARRPCWRFPAAKILLSFFIRFTK